MSGILSMKTIDFKNHYKSVLKTLQTLFPFTQKESASPKSMILILWPYGGNGIRKGWKTGYGNPGIQFPKYLCWAGAVLSMDLNRLRELSGGIAS